MQLQTSSPYRLPRLETITPETLKLKQLQHPLVTTDTPALLFEGNSASKKPGVIRKVSLWLGIIPASLAAFALSSSNAQTPNEPKTIQLANPEKSPKKVDDNKLDKMLETATEQQTKLNQMLAELEKQEKALSIMNKKLAVLNNQVDYAMFAKRKQEAIAKVQAAQFILNDSGTKFENGKQVSFIGSTAGWVTKDWSGNLMMLGCAHGVKDSYDANPKHEFEIILGDLKFKTTLAQDLPKGLKPYSSSQDLCWIAVPNDPKIRQKLEKLALPMANLMNRTIPTGTEAIAIGSPLDTIRYVTEGIISEQDHTGTRKNRGQSSIYPLLYSDAGTNSGNSGGPLIAYNWESNEWEVVASTVAKQNDTFHFAICTPLSAYQAFLSERGMNTVDKKDPKAVQHAEEILEPDRGFPLKQRKIIDKYLDGVFAEVKVDLNDWLKKNSLTREGYINDILQKRFHPMTESPLYQKRIMLPFLNVEQPFTDAEVALKEMVKKVVLNQN